MRGLYTPGRVAAAALAVTMMSAGGAHAATAPSCQLQSAGGKIAHVVYLQFDNVHLSRDNPNVPSDLEQMPSLMNFFEQNGTLMSRSHTGLISHTATGFLSGITGLYGDRLGMPIANSFVLYHQDGTVGFPGSFSYWTAKVADSTGFDTTPNLVDEKGVTAPAPWVTYTRAGCNYGAVAMVNNELENVKTSSNGDITIVFGSASPEATEAAANSTLAAADFEGIAIHCAAGSPLCANSPNVKPDLLPDEVGGYTGFQALFGHKYVAPQITKSGVIDDITGAPITDGHGNPGFPGFDLSAAQSLGYAAQMLENNVQVVYVNLADLHDNHGTAGGTFGPGEAGYVAQLQAANAAFAAFFKRLATDGIDQTNTLFVITADEGDHFVGAMAQNCDGVTTPCTYVHSGTGQNIGEIDADLTDLLVTERNNSTAFDYHFDSAPTINVFGTPGPVLPAQNSPTVRTLERDVGALTAVNPLRQTADTLTQRMVDHAAMQTLHMMTVDPLRNPTFVMFANDDYFFQTPSKPVSCVPQSNCVFEESGFAWNHGDFQQQIAQTFLGIAGPGVLPRGLDNVTWSDHVDVRPTMMALIGLQDSYTSDGRVLIESLDSRALPPTLANNAFAYLPLALAFKRINGTFQDLGMSVLQLSTKGMLSGSTSSDSVYTRTEQQITYVTALRDDLAGRMKTQLNGAAFNGKPINTFQAFTMVIEANLLADEAEFLAGGAPAE